MRRFALTATLAAALSLATLVTAASADPEPAIDCSNANSTVEMNFCADKDYQAADTALNAAYREAIESVKSRGLEKPYDAQSFEDAMRKSQRAWVAFRDADCKELAAQYWAGGTGTTSAVLGCMTEKTVQRTKELKELYTEH